MAPQARLENERAMAARFGCSRDTLRLALDDLEVEGMLWRQVGKGTFLGPRPIPCRVSPLVLARTATPADIIEARLIIEPGTAAMAARRARPPDVARLRVHVDSTRSAKDWQSYERADNALHSEIAAISGNPMAVALFRLVSDVRSRVGWQRQHDRTFRQGPQGEYAWRQAEMHRHIVDAIQAGDAVAAARAMTHHLEEIQTLMAATDGQPTN